MYLNWRCVLVTFFFKSSENGTFWAKLRRVKMAWTFLPNTAQSFRFKNWCKITSWKKSSLTLALSRAVQWVKLPFFQKNAFFGQKRAFFQKIHFIQKCSVTQNTVFQCVKNIVFLSQKKLVFFTEFNLIIMLCYTGIQTQLTVMDSTRNWDNGHKVNFIDGSLLTNQQAILISRIFEISLTGLPASMKMME